MVVCFLIMERATNLTTTTTQSTTTTTRQSCPRSRHHYHPLPLLLWFFRLLMLLQSCGRTTCGSFFPEEPTTATTASFSEPGAGNNNHHHDTGKNSSSPSSSSSLPAHDDVLLLDFYDDFGGIPFDASPNACRYNSNLLSSVLTHNASYHVLRFAPNHTFYFVYGIQARHVENAIMQIDGILRFQRVHDNHHIQHHDIQPESFFPFPACITIEQSRNVTLTSSGSSSAAADSSIKQQQQQQQHQSRGIIDGQGWQWWGLPGIGYLQTVEHRPRLLRFNLTQDLLIENLILRDSPYHTLFLDTVNRVEIRHVSIVARRTGAEEPVVVGGGGGGGGNSDDDGPPAHSLLDLTAFNTDGIDVSGHNVWVHDCDIWVQDDCIAVKDHGNHSYLLSNRSIINNSTTRQKQQHYVSSNMTFERINATGLGFVIGSILGKSNACRQQA
jgi:Glycosyl hydrolases family 28